MSVVYKEILTALIKRRNLTETEAADSVDAILNGEWTDAQIGAFLASLASKGETIDEVAGAARAMRRKAVRVQCLASSVVDTCGTGGDGLGTFNISTTTAFVVAGAGVAVAKHGNRSVSSLCGSADVLEALGLNLQVHPEIMEQALNEIGVAFLFAPLYHGAMKHAMPARKQLGVRTLFNMLGPLANPAGATAQLLGVFAPPLTEMFAGVLQRLGTRRAFVVHGHDGLDEISISAPTRVTELKDGTIKTYDLSPDRFFGELAEPGVLQGGDAACNAGILKGILSGEKGPRRHIVLLNAAAALTAAGKTADIPAGLTLAAESIDSGRALDKLESLIAFTKTHG
jgi:anthranilate phosphoribosyltransferase